MIKLDLKTMLPTIREAFDNKTLQMFQEQTEKYPQCLYAGPCAIGICIPEEIRQELDEKNNSSITSLMIDSTIVAPGEQMRDIEDLQSYHDDVVSCRRWSDNEDIVQERINDFGTLLSSLEEKYA